MPLRWYGNGDPNDPLYLHFSRIVNLTIHFMAFAAINSGLWLAQQGRHDWPQLYLLTGIWSVLVISHLIFVIIRKPPSSDESLLND